MKTPGLHRFLVGWYPAPWRERYGAEFLALLDERPPGLRQALDIVSAALDARIHPQLRSGPLLAAGPPVAPEVRLPSLPPRSYGVVPGPSTGAMSRRTFMRRMLGAGAALLSLEFLGGTLAFLWPQFRSGLGAKFRLGKLADIVVEQPSFANGWPFSYAPARTFLVNVPAAKELALGHDVSLPDPTADQLLALWRKCPHLGCQVPSLCESLKRFTCRCHGSTYNILGEKLKQGPAARGMDRFAVQVNASGVVVIDTSQYTFGALDRQDVKFLSFVDAAPYDRKCQ